MKFLISFGSPSRMTWVTQRGLSLILGYSLPPLYFLDSGESLCSVPENENFPSNLTPIIKLKQQNRWHFFLRKCSFAHFFLVWFLLHLKGPLDLRELVSRTLLDTTWWEQWFYLGLDSAPNWALWNDAGSMMGIHRGVCLEVDFSFLLLYTFSAQQPDILLKRDILSLWFQVLWNEMLQDILSVAFCVGLMKRKHNE